MRRPDPYETLITTILLLALFAALILGAHQCANAGRTERQPERPLAQGEQLPFHDGAHRHV